LNTSETFTMYMTLSVEAV